jgi:hypothetical protein
MSLARLALLLLILGGITLFALQNWLPALPLVILGAQTQALPLTVWMLGAIAAGASTTLAIAGLFRLSNSLAVRSHRSSGKSAATQFDNSPQKTWRPAPRQQNAEPNAEPMDVPFTVTNPPDPFYSSFNSSYNSAFNTSDTSSGSNSDDDWGQSQRPESWENWEDDRESAAATPSTSSRSSSQTVLQDDFAQPNFAQAEETATAEQEDWEDYEEPDNPDDTEAFDEEFEFEDEPEDEPEANAVSNLRPIYEVQQDPKMRYQSGSVYSYSYRNSGDANSDDSNSDDSNSGKAKDNRGVGKTAPIEAADYRVIIPPYHPPSPSPAAPDQRAIAPGQQPNEQEADEEDWGFDDQDDSSEDDSSEDNASRKSASNER